MIQSKMSCTWDDVQAKESTTPTLHAPEYFLRYSKRQSKQKKNVFCSFLVYFMENEKWLQIKAVNKKSQRNY